MEEDDEEIEWKELEDTEEAEPLAEEENEEKEGGEIEDKESIENIIKNRAPQTFIRRIDAEQITPFLEQEPIENLEQGLENAPATQTQENQEKPTSYTVNAPRYSSSDYETSYDTIQEVQRRADPEMADVSLMRRETDIFGMGEPQERIIDFARWQQTHMERGAEEQERYARETRKIKEEDKLPFQRKNKKLF